MINVSPGAVLLGSIIWVREVSTGDDSEIFVDEAFLKSPVGKLLTGKCAGNVITVGNKKQAYKLIDVR